MPLTTRSPVRLASEPSSGPYEIMAASQQAHIDELVQKNRTSEHTIKKLQHSLEEEKERANDFVKRLKAASADERKEWREGCDSLLGCHRIVHLRTRVELEKERMNVLREREETRKERLAVLQRDFKLTLFLAKEAEFETYTARLKEQLEELNAEKEASEEDLIASHDQELLILRGDLSKAEAAKKEKTDELKRVQKEMVTLRAETVSLREAKTTTKASNETLSTKLERAQLQLDGAKTTQAELETKNSELKRTNTDLKRQLDKWQSLETKGGMEMEELRKRCITLEVHEKELDDRVKDLEKALESERRKVAKLRDQIEKLSEVAEEAQEHATEKQNEADAAIAELARAQKAADKLKAKLQVNTDKSTTNSKKPKPLSPLPPSSDAGPVEIPGSEREVEMVVTPVAPSRPRPRPRPAYKNAEPLVEPEDVDDLQSKKAGKRKATIGVDEETAAGRKRKKASEEDELVMIEPPAKSNLKGKGKEKKDSDDDDEIVDVTPQKKSKKEPPERKDTKPSKKKKDEKETAQEEEEETEVEERRRKDKGKGKAKVKAEDSDVEELPVPKAKPRSRSAKPASLADSKKAKAKQPVEEEEETVEDDPQPKKKKKRIFTNSQPTTFDWSSMPPQADGGLNIPTELSPVKETEAVPARSMFGKLLGFR